jgi:hypothetical protein
LLIRINRYGKRIGWNIIASNKFVGVNIKVSEGNRVIDIIDIPVKMESLGLIKKLSEARDLASNLNEKDLTLEIHYKGAPVMRLGKGANPKLSKIITLSGNIEIKDILGLKKLNTIL